MKHTLVVCLLMAGCTLQDAPPVPVPPMPEDLSTWTAPEWVPASPAMPTLPMSPAPRPAAANEVVYAYQPGRDYVINVALGWPADVVLEPAETVHNIVGGDRAPLQEGEAARWEMKEGRSDSDQAPVPHVFFTASHVGHKMGVVVTTNRRTYYLTVRSVKQTPVRAVRWTYPTPPTPAVVVKPPTILPDASQPQRYHVGYQTDAPTPAPDWTPTQVLDDGRKTYVLFPPTVVYQAAPLVRLIGPQGPQVVNSRQVGTAYVIDQLIGRAELRVGAGEHAQVITITRGPLQTIACPGHAQCPVWPYEARNAGRTH